MAQKKKRLEFDQEYEVVPIGKLEEHPKNPRRGVVEAIEKSIDINGWYGAVIAQKSTGYILAGNHRYRAAKKQGAKEIPVIWREVDDETAIRILLADNRTADLGTYDEDVLEDIMAGLETLDGTGYDIELEAIVEQEEAETNDTPGADEIPEDKYTPQYGVIVVCEDEPEQQVVYDKLQGMGYTIRVVAV